MIALFLRCRTDDVSIDERSKNRFRKEGWASLDCRTGSFLSLAQIDILRPSVHLKKAGWRKPGATTQFAISAAVVDCDADCELRRRTNSAATRRQAGVQAAGSYDSGARWSSSADRDPHSH